MRITIYGNPILRAKGVRVEEVAPELVEFADAMIETMRAVQGIGLAAQQVGRSIQLCVVDLPAIRAIEDSSNEKSDPAEIDPVLSAFEPIVLFNPDIEPVGKEQATCSEGCLSFPEITGNIRRSTQIRVTALDRSGKPVEFIAKGLLARAIQHEHDHLHGILFIDRMSAAERAALSGKLKRLKKTGEEQARESKRKTKD